MAKMLKGDFFLPGRGASETGFAGDASYLCAGETECAIIVYNCDNGLFLPKSLGSAVGQTLEAVEIIVVDDASRDNSMGLLRQSAAADRRIKLIVAKERQGLLKCLLTALREARAEAALILDSRDYLASNACASCLRAVRERHDIVKFGINLLLPANVEERRAQKWRSLCNFGSSSAMRGAEIPAYLLAENNYSPVNFCAYRLKVAREMLNDFRKMSPACDPQKAFAEALAANAESLFILEEKLYNYRIFSELDERNKELRETAPERTPPENFNRALKAQGSKCLQAEVANLVENVQPEAVTGQFNQLAARYGILELLQAMRDQYGGHLAKVAAKLKHYEIRPAARAPQRIGIYYGQLLYGGTERIVLDLADLLIAAGYEVAIFLWLSRPRDAEVNPKAKIVYVPQRQTNGCYSDSLRSLCKCVSEHSIDLMLFQDPWHHEVLWEAMALRYLGIAVILLHNSAFYLPLVNPGSSYDLEANAEVFSCLDKVICLSPLCELYFRSQGVDAKYIFNPVRIAANPPGWSEERMKRLVFVGRMDSAVKRTRECFYILAEILKSLPEVTMWFVGSFNDPQKQTEFLALAATLGIMENIRLVGWSAQPGKYLDRAAVLLSTSYVEGFPLAVSEAQARGLPCVIYELSIAAAEDNESIIQVPQGNRLQAATEIVRLLTDKSYWLKLSAIAKAKAARFAPEKYLAKIMELLKTYSRQSDLVHYPAKEYQRLMKVLGFYGGQLPPWK